jgi:tripartite-type tricarboxylate transporter receptor subunit TctC
MSWPAMSIPPGSLSGPVRQYLDSGKLVALAIGDTRRSSLAPAVPTLTELGYKDVVVAWNGFFAPKKTPAVINLLNEHLNAICESPKSWKARGLRRPACGRIAQGAQRSQSTRVHGDGQGHQGTRHRGRVKPMNRAGPGLGDSN